MKFSVFLCLSVSVCLSVCLSVFLSVYLSVCFSLSLFLSLSLCLSVSLPLSLSLYLSLSLSFLVLIDDNPSDKIAIVEEELDGIDRDDIGNLEDLLRLV